MRRVDREDVAVAAAESVDGAVATAFVFGRLAAGADDDDDDADAAAEDAALGAATGATNLRAPTEGTEGPNRK